MSETPQENEIIAKLTEVMREADKAFETVGGGTRHYVRDCLLPLMRENGLQVINQRKEMEGENKKLMELLEFHFIDNYKMTYANPSNAMALSAWQQYQREHGLITPAPDNERVK